MSCTVRAVEFADSPVVEVGPHGAVCEEDGFSCGYGGHCHPSVLPGSDSDTLDDSRFGIFEVERVEHMAVAHLEDLGDPIPHFLGNCNIFLHCSRLLSFIAIFVDC